MIETDRRWNLVTILVQSVLLFFATFLLSAMPHLLDDTYATVLEGALLPAMTQWIRDFVPEDMAGILCLATSATITNFCIGLMLIVTASSALNATQRTIFLTSTTWGIVLFSLILLLVALALPFVTIIGRLSTEQEMYAEAARSRQWIAWTATYCIALIGSTVLICRKKRKVEP